MKSVYQVIHIKKHLTPPPIWRSAFPRRYTTQKSSDPLRILFCGSEEFSIASLRALHVEHVRNRDFIASIDVVCKPGKRVGRNLKEIREVPISAVAKELSLPLHQIDTFTGWELPTPQGEKINLIVAVSFGLRVPPRLLNGARYGGLNVHPSMLPDFRGPAPLHHTLLSGEKKIGISLQTLHPEKFDHGKILAQTGYPGIEHSCSTVPELLAMVAPKGAEMLIKGLKDRMYVLPMKDVGSPQIEDSVRPLRLAPKITPDNRHINWDTWTAEQILRTHRVLGALWNIAQTFRGGQICEKRIIWAAGFRKLQDPVHIFPDPGHPMITGLFSNSRSLLVRTCDGHALLADQVKIESEATAQSWQAIKRSGMIDLPDSAGDIEHDFILFRAKLR